MTCNSTADHPSSALRRQQSLLRSLSAIHHSPHGALPSTNDDVFAETRPGSLLKRDHRDLSSRAVAPDLPAQELPALPFFRDGSSPPRERPAKKVQRRRSPVNSDGRLRRRTSATTPPSSSPAAEGGSRQRQHNGFRGDYSLGETIRCPSHMIVESTSELAIQAARSLREHDFAFVRRSDGSYSYAILAYRSVEPIVGGGRAAEEVTMEECVTFVVDEGGSTKTVRQRHWDEFVRLVSTDGSCCNPATGVCSCRKVVPVDPPASCEEIQHEIRVDWVPPSVIAFIPQMDEECSLISNVSDRARGL